MPNNIDPNQVIWDQPAAGSFSAGINPNEVVWDQPQTNEEKFAKLNKYLEDRAMVGQRAFEGMTDLGNKSKAYDAEYAALSKGLEDQALFGQRALDENLALGESSRRYDEEHPGVLKNTLRRVTNAAKFIPYGAVKALQGATAPLAPILAPLGTPQAMEEAAQYWKPSTDINIPDIGVGFENGRPVAKYQPQKLEDLFGSVAESAGGMAGPIPLAMKAGRLVMGQSTMGPAAQRVASGVVGGALLGEGDPGKTLESAAMFGLFEAMPALATKVKDSSWFRGLTIRERGLMVQSFDDMVKRGYPEGEILRNWDNPSYRNSMLEKIRDVEGQEEIRRQNAADFTTYSADKGGKGPPAATQPGPTPPGGPLPTGPAGVQPQPAGATEAPNFKLVGKPYSTDIKLDPKDVIWDRPLLPAPPETSPPTSGAGLGDTLPSPGVVPDMAGGNTPPIVPGQVPTVPDHSPTDPTHILDPDVHPVVRVPTEDIKVNPKVFQFKQETDAEGVQTPLKGKWDDLSAGNLLLWESKDGTLYVANGHHRLAHAKKENVDTVHSQILREVDGYTPLDARRIAAESNIKDGKGTIYDHAEFFRTQPEYDPGAISLRGLGGKGYTIGRFADDNTYSLFRDEKITTDQAAAISSAAPGNPGLQAAGVSHVIKNPSAKDYEIRSFLGALEHRHAPTRSGNQIDMFGFDDSAIRSEAENTKKVAGIIKELREDLNSISGAARRPERAKKLGVDVTDPQAVATSAAQLKAEIASWEKWYNDPEKIAVVEGHDGLNVSEPRWEFGGRIPFGAVEVVQPGGIKRQKVDKSTQQPLFGPEPGREVPKKKGPEVKQLGMFDKPKAEPVKVEDNAVKKPWEMSQQEAIEYKKNIDDQHSRLVSQEMQDIRDFGKDSPEARESASAIKAFEYKNVSWVGGGGAEKAKAIHRRMVEYATKNGLVGKDTPGSGEPMPEPPKKETAEIPADPKWAVPGSMEMVKGVPTWEGRFSRGSFSTEDVNFEKSRERAVEVAKDRQVRREQGANWRTKYDRAISQVKTGNYGQEEIAILAGRSNGRVSTTTAEGIIRQLGNTSKQARKVVRNVPEVGSTANGAILYDLKEVLEYASRRGYIRQDVPKARAEWGKPDRKEPAPDNFMGKSWVNSELPEKKAPEPKERPSGWTVKKNATFEEMVKEAARWRSAAMSADALLVEVLKKAPPGPGDHQQKGVNKVRFANTRMTTKGDLDAYLKKKFGVDDVTARDVSNELTKKNIPWDKSRAVEEFRGEPWADKALEMEKMHKTPEPAPAPAPEKPREQMSLIGKKDEQLTLFEATKEYKTIPDKKDMVPWSEIRKWEVDNYFKDHVKISSSREIPMPPYPWKEGDWMLDDAVDLPYGHSVEKLVRLPVKDLVLTEEDYTKGNYGGRGDDARRYAGWIKEGKEPPPISVVETDSGTMSVSNGHRRVAAAKLAGKESILAWVSPRMEVGKTYGGTPLYVGMTYEGATLGPKEAEKQRNARRTVVLEEKKAEYQADAEPGPIWFSKMAEVLDKKLPNSGTPEGMLEAVRAYAAKGDFKANELKWSGLEEWLEGKHGKVTKADVVEFVKSNQVEVKESIRQRQPLTIPEQLRYGHFLNNSHKVWSEADQAEFNALREKALAGQTKFDEYALPGGKNYRELLLTLPKKEGLVGSRFQILYSHPGKWTVWDLVKDNSTGEYFDNQTEAIRRAEEYNKANKDTPRPKVNFMGGHFNEPNVFAHVRMDDRTNAQGEKVLFLEEIQSDWALEGRKKGYIDWTDKEQNRWNELARKKNKTSSESDELASLNEKKHTTVYGTPPFPFVHNWNEVALKRMLRYAAENGYSRLAWINGEETAKRYDLSKQIKDLCYKPIPVGGFDIMANPPGTKVQPATGFELSADLIGGGTHDFGFVSNEKLPGTVGKEVAQKIIEGEGQQRGDLKVLAGIDLKTSPAWAFNLYDKMIPEFLKKYGKKWGALVEGTDIQVNKKSKGTGWENTEFSKEDRTLTFSSIQITPPMRGEVMTKGQTLFETQKGYQPENLPAIVHSTEYEKVRTMLEQRGHQYDFVRYPLDLEIATKALAELRRVEAIPVKGREGAGIITLGHALSDEMLRKGFVDFHGRQVKGIKELIALAQVFRNPHFETHYWFGLKTLPNGKLEIAGYYATSSKVPGHTGTLAGPIEKTPQELYRLKERIKRWGADVVFSVHNHPSGIIMLSPEDGEVNAYFAYHLRGIYRAMLTLDHEKYGQLFATAGKDLTQVREVDISTGKEDPFLKPSIDHPVIGMQLMSPRDVAAAFKELRSNDKRTVLLFLNAELKINGIQDIPNSTVKREDFVGYLRNRGREFGSQRAIVVTPNIGLYPELEELYNKGYIHDAIIGEGYSTMSLRNTLVETKESKKTWLGKKTNAINVASPVVAYGPSRAKDYIQKTKELVKYSGDLQDDYYRLRNKSEIDRILTKKFLEDAKGTPGDYRAIYDWIEDPKEPITPRQKELYDTEIEPIRTERNALFSKLRNEGIPVEGEGYVPRFVADRGGFFDRLINGMKTSNAGAGLLRRTAQSFNPRVMKAITDAQGNRRIVAIKNETVVGFANGQSEILGKTQRATPKRTEWFDKIVMEKLEALAKDLGIKHERVLGGKGLGGRRLGVSFPGGIKTKHATPEDVIIHEIGHQIDDRYDINNSFFGGSDKAGIEMRRILKKEIRALADLRYEGQQVSSYYRKYVRKGSEKAAVMFQAYLHAPQAFRSTAPNVYQKFVEFLGRNPETRPILDIKPSLVYGDKTIGGIPDYTKFIDKNGKKWTIGEATTKEIEANTKLKYHKNALLNEIITYNELKKVDRAIEYLEALKSDPEFSKLAIKLGTQNIPDGYKTTVLPQLRGYAFPNRIAETFDTFYKHVSQGLMEPSSAYAKINKVLRNAIFFNPLIHIPNITVHAIVNRGTVALANPVAYPRAVKAGWRAIRATLAMNDDYIAALNQGAGLLYSGVQNANLYELMLKKMGSELEAKPELLQKICRVLGYANPAHLIKAIYRFSSQATWAANDIATLQAVFENMARGIPMDEAVEETAKHIPNYRIPPRVMNSTTISKLMRPDSGITMFGAYHYGALKSYGEMAKSLLGKVPLKERVGALDKLAMLGIVTLILYPILDEIAQGLTGKKAAHVRRAGASTFPYKTGQLAKGEISFPAWLQSVLTPSIGLSVGMSLYMGRDPRTGRQMPPGEVALNALAPVSQAKRIAEGKTSGSDAAASLFGISQGPKKPIHPRTDSGTFNEFFGIRSPHKARANW